MPSSRLSPVPTPHSHTCNQWLPNADSRSSMPHAVSQLTTRKSWTSGGLNARPSVMMSQSRCKTDALPLSYTPHAVGRWMVLLGPFSEQWREQVVNAAVLGEGRVACTPMEWFCARVRVACGLAPRELVCACNGCSLGSACTKAGQGAARTTGSWGLVAWWRPGGKVQTRGQTGADATVHHARRQADFTKCMLHDQWLLAMVARLVPMRRDFVCLQESWSTCLLPRRPHAHLALVSPTRAHHERLSPFSWCELR